MTTNLESVRDDMARVEREIAELIAKIEEVENGRGIWSQTSLENRIPYLVSLQKRCFGLQDEKNILRKQLASAGIRYE